MRHAAIIDQAFSWLAFELLAVYAQLTTLETVRKPERARKIRPRLPQPRRIRMDFIMLAIRIARELRQMELQRNVVDLYLGLAYDPLANGLKRGL